MLLFVLRPWRVIWPFFSFSFIYRSKIWVLIMHKFLFICIRRHFIFFICWDEVISRFWLFERWCGIRMSSFWVRFSLLVSRIRILIFCCDRVLSRNKMVGILSTSVSILNCDPIKNFIHIILKQLLVRISLFNALRSENTFLINHV